MVWERCNNWKALKIYNRLFFNFIFNTFCTLFFLNSPG
ncbi:hypothetical protein CLOLEP_02765 [[Clostridium] leptum DSM 753]|uniref:Uncharacterized protein n=1 Tax=[Clostridium] leptum DSM 753 TaxID=428125 RepID=A7VW01_9FIRM|nr:hypothetical protein CLOLEP_02765 [[Clostridium] leptum DSM 753]